MNQQQRDYEEEQPTFCSVPLALTPARPMAMPPMLGAETKNTSSAGSTSTKDSSKLPVAKKPTIMAPMSFKAIKPPTSFKGMKPLGKYTRQTTLKKYVVTTQSE